jgi:hypothetical protein
VHYHSTLDSFGEMNMPQLDDLRMDRFCLQLAAGMNIVDAARNAGFSPTTASRKSYLFVRRPPVAARLLELGTSVEEVRARTSPGGSFDAVGDHGAANKVHRKASAALTTAVALTQTMEEQHVSGGEIAVAPAVPRPSTHLSTMDSGAVRNWLIDFLSGVAEDARARHDRRAAIAASAEIARLHALHVRQTDVARRSVLDGLTGAQLLQLQELLEQDEGGPLIDGDAEEAEAAEEPEWAGVTHGAAGI